MLLAGLAGLELALEAELLEPSDEEAPALLLLEADSLEPEPEPALASPAEPPAAASAPE